jgi:haloalkane dehalogenase
LESRTEVEAMEPRLRVVEDPVAERPAWLPFEEFPFASRFVEMDGHRIHYVDEGSGPVLLFVNAGLWSFVWRDVIVRLRDRFRCVALDFPGAGLSAAAEGYRSGLDASSRILEAFVRELDLRELTLVLHDLGGPVGLASAARIPEGSGGSRSWSRSAGRSDERTRRSHGCST